MVYVTQRQHGAIESPGTNQAYSYDLAGNRTGVWVNGTRTQNLTYNAANQVSGWSYDAAGNLLTDGTTAYTYDALNRVLTMGSTSNTYNADGTLVAQTVSSVTTRSTQDVAAPLSQILSNGTQRYVYGNPAERLFAQVGTSPRAWYSTDALGSVRATLSDAGIPQAAASYDAWGVPETPAIASFGFTGELQQGSDVWLRARWYGAGRGAFGSRDPYAGDAQTPYSLLYYQYGYSNPVSYRDPHGQFACTTAFANLQAGMSGKYAALCNSSYRIAERWVDSGGTNGLGILISLFSANGFPGGTSAEALANRIPALTPAAERLEFILDFLHDPKGTPFRKALFDHDFGAAFQDPWVGESDRQGNHFLTAVGLAYAPAAYVRTPLVQATLSGLEPNPDLLSDEELALRLIVGHEKSPDIAKSLSLRVDLQRDSARSQYQSATYEDVVFFLMAARADAYGQLRARDCFLRNIIPGLPDDRTSLLALRARGIDRLGNSLQDLRLSVRGWRFGKMIRNRELSTLEQAWQWLNRNLR